MASITDQIFLSELLPWVEQEVIGGRSDGFREAAVYETQRGASMTDRNWQNRTWISVYHSCF